MENSLTQQVYSLEDIEAIQKLMKRVNLSLNTQRIYCSFLKKYFFYCHQNHLKLFRGVEPFIYHLIEAGAAVSTQNQAINAIKFYLEKYCGAPRKFYTIQRPNKEKKLPTVLHLDEIDAILSNTSNLKHRMILKTIYACGLRISELIQLEIKDIDGKTGIIHIRQSKGKKDRIVPVDAGLLKELRSYYKTYKPKLYLFEGQNLNNTTKSVPYSASSIRSILKRAVKLSKIQKTVTVHTLRHSYATHLYEHGIDLRSIQALLGHSSSKTTEIYTHVAVSHLKNIPSPVQFLKKSHKLET